MTARSFSDTSAPILLHTQPGGCQPSPACKASTVNSAEKEPKSNVTLQFLDHDLLATSPLEAGIGQTSKGCADVPNPAVRLSSKPASFTTLALVWGAALELLLHMAISSV